MKKFLLLPVILAVGFGVLILINSEPAGGGGADDPNAITTPSGLKYVDEKVGDGEEARDGDKVAVHYTGRFKSGKQFDSSFDHSPPDPLEFTIGRPGIIQGWQEGITGMKVGGKRKLIIPPDLAYGKNGREGIPPNAMLIFEIELVAIR